MCARLAHRPIDAAVEDFVRRVIHLESLEPRRLLSAGVVDHTFGEDGRAPGGEVIAIQSDKTILAERRYVSVGDGTFHPFIHISRLDANGQYDPTFTQTNIQTILANGTDAYDGAPVDVKIAPDGKIVILANTWYDNSDWFVARLNKDGGLDPSFSGDGRLAISLGFSADAPAELLIQSSGKIVAGGAPGHKSFALARWNTNGVLDSSFGNGGVIKFVYGTQRQGIEQLALGPNDSIVAAGRTQDTLDASGRTVALIRFTKDGKLDSTFARGSGARKISGFTYLDDLDVGADGKIYIAKGLAGENSMSVYRFKSDGFTDTSFGVGGKASVTFPKGDGTFYMVDTQSLRVTPAGKVIVAGHYYSANDHEGLFIARLNSDGATDSTFGDLGRTVILDSIVGGVWNPDIEFLSDGRIEIGRAYDTIRLSADPTQPFAWLDDDGTLNVIGTSSADQLSIIPQQFGTIIEAQRNNEILNFSPAAVKRVKIDSGGGNDWVAVSTLSVPATILGGSGNDVLYGGKADDFIGGGSGDDKIYGDDGNDHLDGGLGQNKLFGLNGNDVADYSNQGATKFDLSTAFVADQGGAKSLTALAIKKNNGAGFDLFDVEPTFTLIGTPGNDTFNGLVSVRLNLDASAGDDNIQVGRAKSSNGRVTVSGNVGDDTITMNADTAPAAAYGNKGNDRIMTSLLRGFTDGGDGYDTEDYRPMTKGTVGQTIKMSANCEILYGPNIGSKLIGGSYKPYPDPNLYYSSSSTIVGGAGNDSIEGHAFSNNLQGGAGNDTIKAGGGGYTTMDGGPGADDIYGSSSWNDSVTYGSRTKNLRITMDDIADDGEAGEHDNVHSNIEDCYGGSGNDYIAANALRNEIHAGSGHDTVYGDAGNDTIFGDGNSDLLYGDAGNDGFSTAKDKSVDTIFGGRGDDYANMDTKTVKDIFTQ
jgi:uncharacterized delta-60 repeat protein